MSPRPRLAAERGPIDSRQRPPVVILVRPQLAENIGTVARAMLNCGLEELRLVEPRHGWPNSTAWPSASGADTVLERALVFAQIDEAIADLSVVYACTARLRDMVKPVVTPRQAAAEMRRTADEGGVSGVLLGPERNGLSNDEVVLAQKVIHAPLNPDFRSLNLAQAVLLFAYEWRMAPDPQPASSEPRSALDEPASQAEMLNLFGHLEDELDDAGFFAVAEKKPSVVRRIRNIFSRSRLTRQEVRMLRGIIKALRGRSRSAS